MSPVIRSVALTDAAAICGIYNHYVAHTVITFEQDAVTAAEMKERIAQTTMRYPWLVCATEEDVRGYAYATRWRARAAYDQTVETTVYVAHDAMHRGLGYALYMRLMDALRGQGLHAAVGCIALPNPPSVALHEKCGFRKVGHFPEAGRKFGKWVDVGFWQVLL